MANKLVQASEPRYKLWLSLILGVPVATLIYFSSGLISEKRKVALEMNQIDDTSHIISRSSDLIHELQRERGYTSGFIASKGMSFKEELMKQRTATDMAYLRFLGSYSYINQDSKFVGVTNKLDLARAEFGKLGKVRVDVYSQKITYFDALEYYSKINSLFLEAAEIFPQRISDDEISSVYLASSYLQQVKEYEGIQRALLTHAFEADKFLHGHYGRFLGIVEDESYSQRRFLSLAPPDIRQTFLKISSTPQAALAEVMKKIAVEEGAGGKFFVDAAYWNAMQTFKMDGIKALCVLIDERATKIVDNRLSEAKRNMAIYEVVNLSVLVFVIIVAFQLFRNIAKRLETEKRIGNALSRAGEVLDYIVSPPEMIPFFIVSPIYRTERGTGGGDSVKWVRFQSRYAGLYMHDVAGHDIEEILLNIMATALVDLHKTHPAKKSACVPSVFLDRMNNHITKYCEGTPDYLTAIYLLMDFEGRKIRMAAAGHPRPWLITPDGEMRRVEMSAGCILGQFVTDPLTSDRYEDAAFCLRSGQLLLVYSDGLMEQKDSKGTTFGSKFTKEIGKKLAGMEPLAAHELIKREFEEHLNGRIPEDDVSFVFVGTRPANKYETLRFIPTRKVISAIRAHKNLRNDGSKPNLDQEVTTITPYNSGIFDCTVIHRLSDSYWPIVERLRRDHWMEARINEVKLAVSEMIINSIMHGNKNSDKCEVELSFIVHENELEISVADKGTGFDGPTLPQVVRDNLLTDGGRGHHIISAMANALYFNEAGNRCWALFSKQNHMEN